jgi:NAD(P)-dependent dehydrogenase (short-subunit alcohol dehydrogenase family)
MNRLENKIAIVYSDGTVGAATAKAFAKEGAKVFIAGRTQKKLDQIAREINSNGGSVEIAKLDLLDEAAVEKHFAEIISKVGEVDISFNAIGLTQKGIQGMALAELSLAAFLLPITTYLQSQFITSKVSVRQMAKQGNGVILMHTPNASRISPPFVGGMVPTWAGIEGLCRSLSVEYGGKGVRSVCLLTTGIPGTPLIDDVWEIHGKAHGITFEQFHGIMEGATHRKKLTTLKEFTDAAIFAASEEGSALSGTILNLTAGTIVY